MIRIAFTGSRTYEDYSKVLGTVRRIKLTHPGLIVHHGCAEGLDSLVERACEELGINNNGPVKRVRKFSANWDKYGDSAGPKRNKKMVASCSFLIAFPGGKGTEDCKSAARSFGVPIYGPYNNGEYEEL